MSWSRLIYWSSKFLCTCGYAPSFDLLLAQTNLMLERRRVKCYRNEQIGECVQTEAYFCSGVHYALNARFNVFQAKCHPKRSLKR